MLAGGVYERTAGAAGQPLGGYQRRAPERTVLHELVAQHAQTMFDELRDADGRGLPRYVERELDEYLRCGMLVHGFARVRCQACGDELVVAFSCKRRGICPSCTARRMADTAAHLADHVLPRAPYRQWVFTVPSRCGWCSRAIQRGRPGPQRFGGWVNLNVHFHLVVPDGVFVTDGDGSRFQLHPVPTSADVLHGSLQIS